MSARARIPTRLDQLQPKLKRFQAWLIERGSAILAPTNDYEVLRFFTGSGPAVIYRNKAGRLAFANNAQAALVAFCTAGDWRATPRPPADPHVPTDRKREQRILSIAFRDGWTCGLCGGALNRLTATLEHFVPRTAGGPDHPANLILAHRGCNAQASHMSVREKLELALTLRRNPVNDEPDAPEPEDSDSPWAAVSLDALCLDRKGRLT